MFCADCDWVSQFNELVDECPECGSYDLIEENEEDRSDTAFEDFDHDDDGGDILDLCDFPLDADENEEE